MSNSRDPFMVRWQPQRTSSCLSTITALVAAELVDSQNFQCSNIWHCTIPHLMNLFGNWNSLWAPTSIDPVVSLIRWISCHTPWVLPQTAGWHPKVPPRSLWQASWARCSCLGQASYRYPKSQVPPIVSASQIDTCHLRFFWGGKWWTKDVCWALDGP